MPTLSHANRAFGIFAEAEQYLTDVLNHCEDLLKHPVEVFLSFLGLLNAGVEFSAIAMATWLVHLGLIVGMPFGVLLFGWFAALPLKPGLPSGARAIDLLVIGCVAAIGCTGSLFIAAVALDSGTVQDAAKTSALLSSFAAMISLIVGKPLKIENLAG